MIGFVVKKLGKTVISIVRWNKRLKYVNETFKIENEEDDVMIDGISSGIPPHLRIGDHLSMNNSFSEFSEGSVLGLGAAWKGLIAK